MEADKSYRGPPPRKDLVVSPSRERDCKGNDCFSMQTNNNNDEKQEVHYGINGAPGLDGDYVDPHLKSQRDYGSDYAKLAMQGGQKDLLRMNSDEQEHFRMQKGCENISDYNRMARQGGHKDLLVIEENKPTTKVDYIRNGGDWFSHDTESPETTNRKPNSSSGNPSPDLLVIEENKPTTKVDYVRNAGDWFSHDTESPKTTNRKPNSSSGCPSSGQEKKVQRERVKSACTLPSGPEQTAKGGKKRFEQSQQRRDAPFATFY